MQTYIVIVSGSILNVSTVHLNGIWHLIWRFLLKPVLGGCPVLSGHYSIPRGCPLNTGFTVYKYQRDVVGLLIILILNVWWRRRKKDHLISMILKASVTNLPVYRDRCLRHEFQFTMNLLNTFRPLFMDGVLSFKGNCEIHVSTFNKRVNFVKLQP